MSDDHATPKWLMRCFEGWFDPCPLGAQQGGLEALWPDKTYCNPPYSDPAPWIAHAIRAAKAGRRVVLLTRVDPSTEWWLDLVAAGFRVAFFHGRIKFTGGGSPNFASALWFSGDMT